MLSLYMNPASCGVYMIAGESLYKTPETFMKDFGNLRMGGWDHSLFVYTHMPTNPIGASIEEYIDKHGLGKVAKIEGPNPTHGGHTICVWVWSRDNKAFFAHHAELVKPPEEKEKDDVQPPTDK